MEESQRVILPNSFNKYKVITLHLDIVLDARQISEDNDSPFTGLTFLQREANTKQ